MVCVVVTIIVVKIQIVPTSFVRKPLSQLFLVHLFEMYKCPADEGGDMGHKGLTAGGETIFYAWWHFGIQGATNQTYLLQTFERLREHFLGTIRHLTVQLVETKCAFVVQLVQHKQRPFVAEFVNHIPNRTVHVLRIYLLIYFSHIHVY